MKKTMIPLAFAAILLAASCADAPKADVANAGDKIEAANAEAGEQFQVNLQESQLKWIGSKPVGSQHSGTINLSKGHVSVADGQVTGGSFVVDMTSIQPTDQNEEDNAKLKGHLASDDFFSVEKFPEGTFEITSVSPLESAEHLENKSATHTVTGNLTLKGITKSISFPAAVIIEAGKVVADAEFNIIRTDWNINFNSDESIKDKFINKEINLNLHLVAQK